MKFKGFRYDIAYIAATFFAACVFATVTGLVYHNKNLAVAEAVVFGLVFLYGFVRTFTAKIRYKKVLLTTAKKLDYTDNKVLSNLPFPVTVCDDNGLIVWSNEIFIKDILDNDISGITNIHSVVGDIDTKKYSIGVKTNNKYYSIFTIDFKKDGTDYKVYCFADNTKLKSVEEKYIHSIPYVMIIEIDNVDDNDEIYRDSEKAEINSNIEGMVDSWCEKFNSVVKRIGDDRFMIITEKKNILQMKEDKFSIIDQVRDYNYKDRKVNITLSVGAASADNILLAEKEAKRALDLALDRGGDQVALKEKNEYVFFGGVSKSADKKFKIKSRIWASQLTDQVLSSSQVYVCGHTRSDFDAIGSAFAVAFACKKLGVNSKVLINENNTLAAPLISEIKKTDFADMIVNSSFVPASVDNNSLFILCDTHKKSICDFPALFNSATKKVIIDHHRLDPDADNTGCFSIHNPNASSTCEIVTEILQYMIPEVKLPPVVAGGLLSGIMLDTKSFSINSGVRTFEAAAFLRKSGVDTSKIKRYFSNTIEANKNKNKVIFNTEVYNNCAVSYVDNGTSNPRIIASQSADELLNSSDISASFVMYNEDDKICISARSGGNVNVQLIMESLGGGGHQNMAACQLSGVDLNKAKEILIAEIVKIKFKEK